MTTKQCPQCGIQFEGRANKLYCSLNCKMTAFYAASSKKSLNVNGLTDESSHEFLTVDPSEQPLSVKQNEIGMVTLSVPFSIAEKDMLEKQAAECETVLPNFIRIRCLMDESDIRILRRTINE